jgi:hypothetical protein
MPFEYVSFADYRQRFLEGQGPAGAYVMSLAEDRRENLRQILSREIIGNGPDGSFALQAKAWAVRGVCPEGISGIYERAVYLLRKCREKPGR